MSAGGRRILSLTSDSSLFRSGGGVTMGESLVIKRGDATIYTGGSGKLFSLSLGSRSTTRESELLISGEEESDKKEWVNITSGISSYAVSGIVVSSRCNQYNQEYNINYDIYFK